MPTRPLNCGERRGEGRCNSASGFDHLIRVISVPQPAQQARCSREVVELEARKQPQAKYRTVSSHIAGVATRAVPLPFCNTTGPLANRFNERGRLIASEFTRNHGLLFRCVYARRDASGCVHWAPTTLHDGVHLNVHGSEAAHRIGGPRERLSPQTQHVRVHAPQRVAKEHES